MLVVYIENAFHARLIRSKLQEVSRVHVALCVSEDDLWREANGFDRVTLFLCTASTALIRRIRDGNTHLSPFCGISLFDPGNQRLIDDSISNIGVNTILSLPFSFGEIANQHEVLCRPKQDFISIPKIYTGPDRRSKQQDRPVDRRDQHHPKEQRYRPIVSRDAVQWQKVPNIYLRYQLQTYRDALRQGGNKVSISHSINDLLQQYQWSDTDICQVLGTVSTVGARF